MKIGYARVSTQEQNLESQISALTKFGCEKIITDIASGVRDNRPGLLELKSILRKNDLVVVVRIDRIFRSLKNMVNLIEDFNKENINFKSLAEPEFDTTSANGKFLLQIFGAVAEFERNLISERTKGGLNNARRRNIKLGRPIGPSQKTVAKYDMANYFYEKKNLTIDQACEKANISKSTFYRIDKLTQEETPPN